VGGNPDPIRLWRRQEEVTGGGDRRRRQEEETGGGDRRRRQEEETGGGDS